ncbi:selenide, water dikinase SelD [Alphaproteobacteria bacterium]|nr:selenide, water dikinase SelD [Alphaproteobacteria bacterium]
MIENEEKPITNDLILVGGGHSHLILIMQFSKKIIEGTRITLISNEIDIPYSGMIPGFIEGTYSWRDSHIDLYKLASRLNIRFIHSKVIKISSQNKEVHFNNRPAIKFDILSINSGIQSNYNNIKGAKKYCVPVKPISRLANNFFGEIKDTNAIAFIGGGAGSVELALALRKRYITDKPHLKITIITGKNGLLSSFPKQLKQTSKNTLKEFSINIIENTEVIEVKHNKIIMSDEKILYIDKCILSTNAMAPDWLKDTDIKLNNKGFIVVNNAFQTNNDFIFAAGDIVDFDNQNFKKAGVYAVRSGKPLAQSIKSYIKNKVGKNYKFSKNYLALIGLSNGYTIGTKYNFSYSSRFNSFLKKYIDQRFINKFNKLNYMKNKNMLNIINESIPFLKILSQKNSNEINPMQCRGCGAKVPFAALKNTLAKNITATSDDASSILNYPNLFHTIDMINAIISDPYLLGKIAANHSLSDIIAVKSNPISALMILQLPLSRPNINSRDLEQVSLGAKEIFDKHNCPINGGHTMIGKDNDPVIGFTITGESKYTKNKNYDNYKLKNNDVLVLTEKIGSGIIFAGINNNMIDSHYQNDVISQMTIGNFLFSSISQDLNILSMTDITGFGLANHLLNLIKRDNNKSGLTIFPQKIPIFSGVKEAIDRNVKSSLFQSNYDTAIKHIIYGREKLLIDEILYDPQTVGGLAFVIPKEEKNKQFAILKKYKINYAEIGYVNNLDNQIEIM